MQIIFLGQGEFKIKSKNTILHLGEKIKINDFLVEGAGEYEVGGITVEVIDSIVSILAEDITLTYLDKRQKPFSETESDRINNVDILLIPVGGANVFTPKQALEVINEVEPSIVIPMHYKDISEFSKLEGVSPETRDELKINKNDINKEERKVVILQPK